MLTRDSGIDWWLQSLTDVAFNRYQEDDITGLVSLIRKFEPLYNAYKTDPNRCAIESAAMTSIVMLATSYAARMDFGNALDHCESVHSLLEKNRARSISQGNNPRPNSLVWCELLSTMSAIKWKAPSLFRDMLISPNSMIIKFIECDSRIQQYLSSTPYNDGQRNESISRRALGCGVEIAKLSYRYAPDQLPILLEIIKRNHGSVLEDTDQPFYWNLEIAHIWCSTHPNRDLLMNCFDQLEGTMLSFWRNSPFLSGFLNQFQIEKDYLLRDIPKEPFKLTPANRYLQQLH